MARNYSLMLLISFLLFSCSIIPSKSIMEPLETNELATIIKKDTLFKEFYAFVRKKVVKLSDLDKAKFSDITYSSFYDCFKFIIDTNQLKQLAEPFEIDWNKKYSMYDTKVDSVVNYWKNYIAKNSLSRYVSIEFDHLYKEYYPYSNNVKEMDFAFKLTPKNGATIQQIKFIYRYSWNYYREEYICNSTIPFSTSVVRYWEVDYTDEKKLKNVSSADFKRDSNIVFEITDLIMNGKNYSIDDLNVPKSVKKYLNTTSMSSDRYRRDCVIKETLCHEYVNKNDYIFQRFNEEILSKRFPREYEFLGKIGYNEL